MVTGVQVSDPMVDPLHGHHGLSMFPRTFRDSINPSNSDHLDDDDDVESIHEYMTSMALKSSENILEQAKVILDGGSELPNLKFPSLLASENHDEPLPAKANENLQERRPALGRKRAQFSLKPTSVRPSASAEPSLDIAQLQDPEEYFLAHEKFENAKKELEKQRGGVMDDFNGYNVPTTARHRRPGILGKSVSYKHHQYSSMLSQSNNSMISSQEILEYENLTPVDYGSQPEATDPNVGLQERELPESLDKTQKSVSNLLVELLSSNCENLEGDGAMSFLRERLQIKPVDVEKLCLPDLHDSRTDFIPLAEKMPKPRKALADIQNSTNGVVSRTPAKRKDRAESPLNLASPTPPKSPFGSISLLKRRILQSTLSSDPFSPLNIDALPTGNCSLVECAGEQSDQVNSRKNSVASEGLNSLVIEKDEISIASLDKPVTSTRDSEKLIEKSLQDRPGAVIHSRLDGAYSDVECYNGSEKIDDGLVEEDAGRHASIYDGYSNRPQEVGEHDAVAPTEGDNNIKDLTGIYTDFGTSGPNQMEENVKDMPHEAMCSELPNINIEDPTVEKLNNTPKEIDQPSHVAVEHQAMEIPSKTPDISSEQVIETSQEASGISLEEQNRAKQPSSEGRKRKAGSSRKSLADQSSDVAVEHQAMEIPSRAQDISSEQVIEISHEASSISLEEQNRAKGPSCRGRKRKAGSSTKSLADQSSHVAVEHQAAEIPSGTPDISSEQVIEEISQEAPNISLEEQNRVKGPPREGRKRPTDTRKSLAAAGTYWDSGKRRSSRIKMRPLEYWKGERFLYGRIHQSLATVIGMKYVSPGKGEGTMRVRSFVADEYKELVELAALH